jgi:hypothetical protein
MRQAAVLKQIENFKQLVQLDCVAPEKMRAGAVIKDAAETFASSISSRNSCFTDANFKDVSVKIVPGQRYRVTAYQPRTRMHVRDCISFVRSQKGVMLGAQGITLLLPHLKALQKSIRYFSVDDEEKLWKSSGSWRVPYLDVRRDQLVRLGLAYSTDVVGDDWTDAVFVFETA